MLIIIPTEKVDSRLVDKKEKLPGLEFDEPKRGDGCLNQNDDHNCFLDVLYKFDACNIGMIHLETFEMVLTVNEVGTDHLDGTIVDLTSIIPARPG